MHIYKAEVYVCIPFEEGYTEYQAYGQDLDALHLALTVRVTEMDIDFKPVPDAYSVFNYEADRGRSYVYASITRVELIC